MQDGNGSWSGCAFLPACSRFLPFRHLLPWLLAHLQMPPIWPGGLWNGATFKFLRGLTSDRGTALSAQCAAGYRARAWGMGESPLSTELYRPLLETLGKAKRRLAAFFKRTHEVTSWQTFAKVAMRHPVACLGLRASFAPACRFL